MEYKRFNEMIRFNVPKAVPAMSHALEVARRVQARYDCLSRKLGYDLLPMDFAINYANMYISHKHLNDIAFFVEVEHLEGGLQTSLQVCYGKKPLPPFVPAENSILVVRANEKIKKGRKIVDYIQQHAVMEFVLDIAEGPDQQGGIWHNKI